MKPQLQSSLPEENLEDLGEIAREQQRMIFEPSDPRGKTSNSREIVEE